MRRPTNSTSEVLPSSLAGGAALTGNAEADDSRPARPGEGTPWSLIVCALLAFAASGLLILAAYLT